MSSAKINLLPDTFQAKLQDKQRRQFAITAAVASVVVVVSLMVLGLLIVEGQNLRIAQLTSSIRSKKAQVKAFPNVSDMLSLQARAAALPQLFNQRLYMTKLLGVLSSQEPTDVAFSSFSFTNSNIVSISAQGKNYLSAAKVALALQQAKTNGQLDFSNVQLSAVSFSGTNTSYSLSVTVNPGVTNGQ